MEAERSTKTIINMTRKMLLHAALICHEETLFTDIWIYNRISNIKSGLYDIEIWLSSRLEPVSETLSNCHVWDYITYILELKLQKPGVNIPKRSSRSRRGVDMGFREIHSIIFGFILNLLTGSI